MLPEDSKANPDLKVGEFGYIDVKSPEKVMTNCCRNANHASDAQHACVCLTDHCFRKPITERQIQDRNKAIWDSKDTTMTISFGMSMASSENTRDQWNNPLASGSANAARCFQWLSVLASPRCKDSNKS